MTLVRALASAVLMSVVAAVAFRAGAKHERRAVPRRRRSDVEIDWTETSGDEFRD